MNFIDAESILRWYLTITKFGLPMLRQSRESIYCSEKIQGGNAGPQRVEEAAIALAFIDRELKNADFDSRTWILAYGGKQAMKIYTDAAIGEKEKKKARGRYYTARHRARMKILSFIENNHELMSLVESPVSPANKVNAAVRLVANELR